MSGWADRRTRANPQTGIRAQPSLPGKKPQYPMASPNTA